MPIETRKLIDLIEPPKAGYWGHEVYDEKHKYPAHVLTNGDAQKNEYIQPQVLSERWFAKKERDRAVLRDNDMVITTSGEPGAVAQLLKNDRDYPVVASNFVKIIRARESISPRWLFYALKSNYFRSHIPRYVQRSVIANLNKDLFSDSELFFFPYDEQQKIAEILTTIDEVIGKTDALIEKQKRIKQGLMQDMFRYGIDENGNIRSEKTHRFKDSPLGRIPEEWECVRFGDYINKIGGHIQTGPFGSQLHAEEYVPEGPPVVMPQDLSNGRISLDNIARITVQKVKEIVRHKMILNDVVIARRGEFNRAAFIDKEQEGWICGTGCLLLRMPSKKLHGKWFSLLYSSSLVQRQLEAIAVGSTMKNINTNVIESLVVAIPPLTEQERISDLVLVSEAVIDFLELNIHKLRALKRGLMDDLLSGAVRVNHLIKE